MRLNAFFIVSLLVLVITAPVVDAIACDDCKDIVMLQGMKSSTIGIDHADGKILSSDAACPVQQQTGTAQDLCPICANIAVPMGNACCGSPAMTSHANTLPKLIAFSDPSYPINKPPQN